MSMSALPESDFSQKAREFRRFLAKVRLPENEREAIERDAQRIALAEDSVTEDDVVDVREALLKHIEAANLSKNDRDRLRGAVHAFLSQRPAPEEPGTAQAGEDIEIGPLADIEGKAVPIEQLLGLKSKREQSGLPMRSTISYTKRARARI